MPKSIGSFAAASALLLTFSTSDYASAALAGPDALGYTFADQDDGASYQYIDITSTGTMVVAGDNESVTVTMGALFEFYGSLSADIVTTTNGFLSNELLASIDGTNDCPIPTLPSVGGGYRLNVLHDDLTSNVYYQYLTEAEASTQGYPNRYAGISVFQWVGSHVSGDGAVDVEALLFHDDSSILTMVAVDADQGSQSTLGIQNIEGQVGLNYACNTAGSVIPGVTAVRYFPGVAPNSDCCTPSPTDAPGCNNTPCQTAVCADQPLCCSDQWDSTCADLAQVACPLQCGTAPEVRLNELRVDQIGSDVDEYVEISGPPGAVLTDIQYFALGDFPTGDIEVLVDLTGQVIPPSGYLLITEATFTLGIPDFTTVLNFENNDTVTHFLVGGLTATLGDNLDADADGFLDSMPWQITLDTVALVDPASSDFPYGPGSSCTTGPQCQLLDDGIDGPYQVFRCPDTQGLWSIGNLSPTDIPATDSPGAPNTCNIAGVCGNGVIDAGEDCDDAGESPLCDIDCTFSTCGDNFTNVSAGEDCDDAGQSAFCDDDCSHAICGDGTVNSAASEQCDAAGESSECNADCTVSTCGDAVVNISAGEDCDDGGESSTCDDDCTSAQCGDGLINSAAGEDCDDAGESAGCNIDCTLSQCGDGIVNAAAGEDCDDAGNSAVCDSDCTPAQCGDGTVNTSAGEECDDSTESALCDIDCTAAVCGDGQVNTMAGETCDDQGRSPLCNENCTVTSCGDGIVNLSAGEDCDGDGLGTAGETAQCDIDCTVAQCGDGIVNTTANEQCDEAGQTALCDDDCTPAVCGDGHLNPTAQEQCDDGNTEPDDGCAPDCTEELVPGTTGGPSDSSSDGGGMTTQSGVDETVGGSTDSPTGSTSSVGTTGGTSSSDTWVGSTGSTSIDPGPSTLPTIGQGSSSGDPTMQTDGDDVGILPGDTGCNCTANPDKPIAPRWTLVSLLGLGALRRRRRRLR